MSNSIRKVLIAEDNPGLARVLSFKFKASGFTPVTCADGLIAWEAFQADDFVAVISDQEMPRMTGVELCRNIRAAHSGTPFFLVTGRQLELVASGIVADLGMTGLFAKPFSPGTVVASVEQAIQQCQSEAAIS